MFKRTVLIGFAVAVSAIGAAGTTVSAQTTSTATIRTIAGRAGLGEGGPALEASLPNIEAVSVDGLGRTLVATGASFTTLGDNRIHRIGLDGLIAPVAGDGREHTFGPMSTGVLATSLPLPRVTSMLGLPDGTFLLGSNFGIFRVGLDGLLTPFANSSRSPTECQAVADNPSVLAVCSPSSLALGSDGSVYVADTGRNTVFAVSSTGVVRRVAGIDNPTRLPPAGDNGPATSATINPNGIAIVGTTVYIGESPWTIRKVRPDGIIETAVSTTSPLQPAPFTSTSDMLPYGVLGQTTSSGVLLQGPRGVLRLRQDGLTESLVGGLGADKDPNLGGPAKAAYAGWGNVASGAPDGTVVVAQNETNEVYRVAVDGTIQRIAGRRYASVVPANQLSLIQTTSLSKSSDGSVLLSEGTWSSRLWRLRNGTFTLLAGSLKPAEQGAQPKNSPFRRITEMRGVAEGCNGNVYIWDLREAIRVDPSGVLRYPVESGKSTLEVTSIGGSCGAMFALEYSGRLLRMNADDTVTFEAQLPPYSTIVGSDGAGGLIIRDGSKLSQRTRNGTVLPIPFLQTAVSTPGGYLGLEYGIPNFFFSTVSEGSLTQLAQLDLTMSSTAPAIDGALNASSVRISRLASNSNPAWSATVLDRSVLRVVTLSPTRQPPGAAGVVSSTPIRLPVPATGPIGQTSPRTPAPSAAEALAAST
jgi:hypothetical protein